MPKKSLQRILSLSNASLWCGESPPIGIKYVWLLLHTIFHACGDNIAKLSKCKWLRRTDLVELLPTHTQTINTRGITLLGMHTAFGGNCLDLSAFASTVSNAFNDIRRGAKNIQRRLTERQKRKLWLFFLNKSGNFYMRRNYRVFCAWLKLLKTNFIRFFFRAV